MPEVLWTKILFLRSVALCYAMAFLSLYPQIPGLYGTRGVLPAKPILDKLPEEFRFSFKNLSSRDTLRNFHPNIMRPLTKALGLSVDLTMDVVCLSGTALSLAAACSPRLNVKITFLILWLLYKGLFSVGQTFMWFQWDTLMLETGFICIVIAPLFPREKSRIWDEMTMLLVRWLLFRMMFASGVVKLLSECPAWWGLTALPVHYESQCLPTPLAWFAYHTLPTYMHKLSVVATYIIEIPLTFLFFAPTKSLKKFAFWMQITLMIFIMLTGNYNFFNFNYIALCLSLMDDSWLVLDKKTARASNIRKKLAFLFNAVIYFSLCLGIYYFFIQFEGIYPSLKVRFTKPLFRDFVDIVSVWSINIVAILFLWKVIVGTWKTLQSVVEASVLQILRDTMGISFYSVITLVMFALTAPRFLKGLNVKTHPWIIPLDVPVWARDLEHLDIFHSYGLFRSMTGVTGRPELILEAGDSPDSLQWTEINFNYKPGALDEAPKFILPHQPRLDWQMWFAALGEYQSNPWLISFIYRVLQKDRIVINLLQDSHIWKGSKAPKFIRGRLFKYKYSNFGLVIFNIHSYEETNKMRNWWRRSFQRHYLPPVQSSDLTSFMIQQGYLDMTGKNHMDLPTNKTLANVLKSLRRLTRRVPHHYLVQTLLLSLIPIYMTIKKHLKSQNNCYPV